MPKSNSRTAAKVKRKQPETLRLSSAAPSFTVTDLLKSIAWYRDILGFHVAEEWNDENVLVGVRLKAGSVNIILGQDDFAQGRDRKKGVGMRIYCNTTQNIDDIAEKIAARGGARQSPQTQPWGTRELNLVDPDGFKITISTAA